MPIGTISWMLLIAVTDPIPMTVPYAEPTVFLDSEAQCKAVADAINAKASQAGLQNRISAKCHQVESVQTPEHLLRSEEKPRALPL